MKISQIMSPLFYIQSIYDSYHCISSGAADAFSRTTERVAGLAINNNQLVIYCPNQKNRFCIALCDPTKLLLFLEP